jgi:hypothetical protein
MRSKNLMPMPSPSGSNRAGLFIHVTDRAGRPVRLGGSAQLMARDAFPEVMRPGPRTDTTALRAEIEKLIGEHEGSPERLVDALIEAVGKHAVPPYRDDGRDQSELTREEKRDAVIDIMKREHGISEDDAEKIRDGYDWLWRQGNGSDRLPRNGLEGGPGGHMTGERTGTLRPQRLQARDADFVKRYPEAARIGNLDRLPDMAPEPPAALDVSEEAQRRFAAMYPDALRIGIG